MMLDQFVRDRAREIITATVVDDEGRARMEPDAQQTVELSIREGASLLDRGVAVVRLLDASAPGGGPGQLPAGAIPRELGPGSDPQQ